MSDDSTGSRRPWEDVGIVSVRYPGCTPMSQVGSRKEAGLP